MTGSCHLSDIIFYPIKSFQGIHVEKIVLTDFGIEHDRRLMLIDKNNKFVTQRTHPKLSQLKIELLKNSSELEGVLISFRDLFRFSFAYVDFFSPDVPSEQVNIWGDWVDALILNNDSTMVLSEFLNMDVRLAFMPNSSFRQVDREFFSDDQRVSFADAYPFLLTSEASLADLNSRLESPVSMRHFRPNLVISGGISAYAEDDWQRITIGDCQFELVKPCSRCVMTTIDSEGVFDSAKEPLKTLASYRKNEFGICFGQNMVHLTKGELKVGDFVSF